MPRCGNRHPDRHAKYGMNTHQISINSQKEINYEIRGLYVLECSKKRTNRYFIVESSMFLLVFLHLILFLCLGSFSS